METPTDYNEDEVIDFDGTIEKDGEGFTTLPDGDEVEFKIMEVEKGRNADGTKPQVKMKVACTSVNGHGRTNITDYLTMTRKSEWKLCELFSAIGMRKHGETLRLDWDIIGKTGRATVKTDSWTSRDGEKKLSNKIKNYLEPADDGDVSFG